MHTQDALDTVSHRTPWAIHLASVRLCCLGHIGWFSGLLLQSVPATGSQYLLRECFPSRALKSQLGQTSSAPAGRWLAGSTVAAGAGPGSHRGASDRLQQHSSVLKRARRRWRQSSQVARKRLNRSITACGFSEQDGGRSEVQEISKRVGNKRPGVLAG